jgi:hypothetical protein
MQTAAPPASASASPPPNKTPSVEAHPGGNTTPRLPLEDLVPPWGVPGGFTGPDGVAVPALADADALNAATQLARRLADLGAQRLRLRLAPRPATVASAARRRGLPQRSGGEPALQPLQHERNAILAEYERWRRSSGVAFQVALHAALAPLLESQCEALDGAIVAEWTDFERGCFLAALTHWSRARVNASRPHAQPLPMAPVAPQMRGLKQSCPTWGTLYTAAADALAAHHRLGLDQVSPLSEETAQQLNGLNWSCGSAPELTPPLVQRRLRAAHRYMLGQVSDSVRSAEHARSMGMNRRTETRNKTLYTKPRATALDGTNRDRTQKWLCADRAATSGPVSAQVQFVSFCPEQRWRTKRNQSLRAYLQPGPSEDVPSLWKLLPPEYRDALEEALPDVSDVANPAPRNRRGQNRTSNTPSRANVQAHLDELWCWFHDFRSIGYPKPASSLLNKQTIVAPERHWVGLISIASALYGDLARNGFDLGPNAAGNSIGISTYNCHGTTSYDVSVPRGTPIRLAQPPVLLLGRSVLGDDPGAPRGRYTATDWSARPETSSPSREVFSKLMLGYFGQAFPTNWQIARDHIRWPGTPPTFGGHSAFQQYLWAAARTSDIPQDIRALLLDGAPGRRYVVGGHPRVPEADEFMGGLFFSQGVVVPGVSDAQAMSIQQELRAQMLHALRPIWPSMRLRTQVGSVWQDALFQDAWDDLLTRIFTDRTSLRGHAGTWSEAVLQEPAYERQVLGEIQADGFALPAMLATALTPDSSTQQFRVVTLALRQAFTVLIEQVLLVLCDATTRDPARSAFHSAMTDSLSRAFRPPQRAPSRTSSAAIAETHPEDETDTGLGIDEPHSEGAMERITYRYRRDTDAGAASGSSDEVWVDLQFMHMTTVNSALTSGQSQHLRATNPQLMVDEAPLLGLTGISGNAVSPHAHLQLAIWAQRPNERAARPTALLSPLDFVGLLVWEGNGASGPWPPSETASASSNNGAEHPS